MAQCHTRPVLGREPHSSRKALLRQRKIRDDGHFVMVAGTTIVVNDARVLNTTATRQDPAGRPSSIICTWRGWRLGLLCPHKFYFSFKLAMPSPNAETTDTEYADNKMICRPRSAQQWPNHMNFVVDQVSQPRGAQHGGESDRPPA